MRSRNCSRRARRWIAALRNFAALLVLAASTSCAAEPVSYAGSPIETATRACLDYLSSEKNPDEITKGTIAAGFKPAKFRVEPNWFARSFKADGVSLAYQRDSRPETLAFGSKDSQVVTSCVIGAGAKTEPDARALIEAANAIVGLPKAGPNVYALRSVKPPQPVIGFKEMAPGQFLILIELYPKTS